MFRQPEAAEPKALLDGFEVPMSAVEHSGAGAPWALVCINAAHEAAAGMPAGELGNREVAELLAKADADRVCPGTPAEAPACTMRLAKHQMPHR